MAVLKHNARTSVHLLRIFLFLLFWVLPIQREKKKVLRDFNKGIWPLVVFFIAYGYINSLPKYSETEYPKLTEASIAEGKLYYVERSSKLYIATPAGNVSVSCPEGGRQGCGYARNVALYGKRTRLWHWRGILIQLEIEGKIVDRVSFEFLRDIRTQPRPNYGLLIAAPFLLVGLGRLLYLYTFRAWRAAFSITRLREEKRPRPTSLSA